MPEALPLPGKLRAFVEGSSWIFAKTYAETWPHEYLVRERVDACLFLELVHHIKTYGYEGRFYRKPITYFDQDGMVYWTMGDPVESTTIINRCTKEQSYEHRLKTGRLPEQIKEAQGKDSATQDIR